MHIRARVPRPSRIVAHGEGEGAEGEHERARRRRTCTGLDPVAGFTLRASRKVVTVIARGGPVRPAVQIQIARNGPGIINYYSIASRALMSNAVDVHTQRRIYTCVCVCVCTGMYNAAEQREIRPSERVAL